MAPRHAAVALLCLCVASAASRPREFPKSALYDAMLWTNGQSKLCANCTFVGKGHFFDVAANRGYVTWRYGHTATTTVGGTTGAVVEDPDIMAVPLERESRQQQQRRRQQQHQQGKEHVYRAVADKNQKLGDNGSEDGRVNFKDVFLADKKEMFLLTQTHPGDRQVKCTKVAPYPPPIFNTSWAADAKYEGVEWFFQTLAHRWSGVYPFFIQGEQLPSEYFEMAEPPYHPLGYRNQVSQMLYINFQTEVQLEEDRFLFVEKLGGMCDTLKPGETVSTNLVRWPRPSARLGGSSAQVEQRQNAGRSDEWQAPALHV